jgi:protein involved in polysaccharide export with SLBB domain
MKKRMALTSFLIVLSVLGLFACSSTTANVPKAVDAGVKPPPTTIAAEYRIQPEDQLDIKFFYNPELNENVTVRPDGKISLQLLDEVTAAGMTPRELTAMLTQSYAKELRKPQITVIVRSFSGQRVYVGGEVTQQGLQTLASGMTVMQAVIQAGGFKDTAMPSETIVIRKQADNQPVPFKVNLASVISGGGPDAAIVLEPADIVYVPMSPIAEANKFVNQYIERLLLFRGVSMGFSVNKEINNSN